MELRELEEEEARQAALLAELQSVPVDDSLCLRCGEPAHQADGPAALNLANEWDDEGPEVFDSISQCPDKFRHKLSYLIDENEERGDPTYRDTAGTGMMSSAERKERLNHWIMGLEDFGPRQYPNSGDLFWFHATKTEFIWGTRGGLDWKPEEKEDTAAGFSWNLHPDYEDPKYETSPFNGMTPDEARRRYHWYV